MRGKKITARLMIPDGAGGFREWRELSSEEQNRFSDRCVERMGAVLEKHFIRNAEQYAKL